MTPDRARTPIASPARLQMQRIVDGAVRDCFGMHPDYLTARGRRSARGSLVKRIVGEIMGFVEQSAEGRLPVAAPERGSASASGASSGRPVTSAARPDARLGASGAICGVRG